LNLKLLQTAELTDWRARWQAIDEFIRYWFDTDFVRDPTDSRIDEIEAHLGLPLPPSVRQWVAFALAAGQIKKNFTFRDSLEIEKMADHDAISLLWQGEADYIWAVELTRWSEPDPAVVAYYLDHDQWPERFELHGPWAPTVSSYALDYLFTYISSNGGGFSTRESQPAFNRDVLVAELGAPTRFGHLELFAKDGVVAVRKEGKLPAVAARRTYDLEYGSATLELPADVLHPGTRVLLVDDVLATGGTAAAACQLVEGAGAVVAAFSVVLELPALEGRARLGGRDVHALLAR